MRTTVAFLFAAPGMLAAQDWTLLNPAYKYNYSLGGTDTITNQVFVTGIDTLGAGSYLFTLNRVVLFCDTCWGDVMSHYIWPDAPQWLGGTVQVTDDVWHFNGNGSRVILPLAAEGGTWLYDTLNGIWAEMGATVEGSTFGLPDEHRTIMLDNGGSLLLSRDHGILSWDSGQVLIGINGPQLGRTIPTLEEFFPYADGDVLEYEKWYGYCDGIGGCGGWSTEFKFTVEEGSVADSAVHFSGWMTAHHLWYFQLGGLGSPTQYVHSYTNTSAEWYAGVPELPWAELLFSHPGQLVQRHHFMDPNGAPNFCIAQHGLDPMGRYVVRCRAVDHPFYESVGSFFFAEAVPGMEEVIALLGPEDNCVPGDPECGVRYVEDLGLVNFVGHYFERGEHYHLRGLVLGGDTVYGSITDDSTILSVNDAPGAAGLTIAPNPASSHFTVEGLPTGTEALIVHDAAGRVRRSAPVRATDRPIIDVSDLPGGIYLLRTWPGNRAQRFVVAR